MAISTSISRFTAYYSHNGLSATARRAGLAARRALFSNRSVLFYCNLATQMAPPAELPSFLKLERKKSFTDLNPEDLQAMLSFGNPKLARQRMEERFDQGASLWLIKFRGQLAGSGWTLRGCAIAPYYFPLAEDDVQFFDFHVFPKYRGRAIDWFLMTHALQGVAADGAARAFAEAAEWNQASLSSIGMTSFRRLGRARMSTIFGRAVVCWAESEALQPVRTGRRERQSASPRETMCGPIR
jgi:ribosomal protein S18 acetylase RimI-like enzyme